MDTIKKIIETKEKIETGWEKNKSKVYLILILLGILLIIAGTAYVTWKLVKKKYEKELAEEEDEFDDEDDFLDEDFD